MRPPNRATWVVGEGGLIGSAIRRQSSLLFAAQPVPWDDEQLATTSLLSDLQRYTHWAAGSAWEIIWAAGSSVVSSPAPVIDAESRVLESFLAALRDRPPRGQGAFFYSSSAGGVYAGSTAAPFDEATLPEPRSPYGYGKLRAERAVTSMLAGTAPVVIGRFSNVYGPGQNLRKAQGMVTRLCLAAATRRAVNIYVPMQTLRDYLYVDDAARQAHAAIDEAIAAQNTGATVRVLASGRPVTVATLVRTTQLVTRHRLAVTHGSPRSEQPLDLRMRSAWHGAPRSVATLEEGISAVYADVLRLVTSP